MKTDREQIRKIADAISYECQQSKTCDNCFERGRVCSDYKTAEKLYSAGYRKASDVIEEFVERLAKKEVIGRVNKELTFVVQCEDIKKIISDMRQEVEKCANTKKN